ncbi:Uncharacterized protein PBTT_04480 [Plasmodiophora brassicae]
MEKSDETPKRKRGRREKGGETSETISWRADMVEVLLASKEQLRSYFLDAKNKQQLSKGWQRLAGMFNNQLGMGVPLEKIKIKYQQVLAQNRKLKAADREMCNNSDTILTIWSNDAFVQRKCPLNHPTLNVLSLHASRSWPARMEMRFEEAVEIFDHRVRYARQSQHKRPHRWSPQHPERQRWLPRCA